MYVNSALINYSVGNITPPPLASGNISPTLGKQFPIVTSTPVTICVMCNNIEDVFQQLTAALFDNVMFRVKSGNDQRQRLSVGHSWSL